MIFDDENAIIGAPGALTWRGAVFVFSISENYLHRNPFVYMGNGTEHGDIADPNERIKKDGYMGKLQLDYMLAATQTAREKVFLL